MTGCKTNHLKMDLLLNNGDFPASHVTCRGVNPVTSSLWGSSLVNGLKLCSDVDFAGTLYMGVSKNRGTPKWMVYNGKPY